MHRKPTSPGRSAAIADRLDAARLAAILETARDAIISIDDRGTITVFNRAAEAIFGYRAAEALGENVALLMPAPYRDEHDRYIADYQTSGVPKAIGRIRQVHGRRKSGEVFPIELAVSETGVVGDVAYTAIIRDVSERKAIEEALRRERDFAERLVDTAQMIVLVLDATGRIVRFNPYMARVSGYHLSEMVGEDWFTSFIPERDRNAIRALFARTVAGQEVRGHVNPILTRRGEEREIEWYANTLYDSEGTIMGILCVGQDITERRRDEQERLRWQRLAQQSERLADVGALTAKIVHDLGNPLAGLSMAAQSILRRLSRNPAEPLETIRGTAEQMMPTLRRLDALVHEFKDFLREQRLALQEVAPGELLGELATLWEPEVAARGIAIALAVAHDTPPVRADPDQLRRVLDNLVKNAIEAIGRGPGTVTLQAAPAGPDRVRLSVRDTGCGIPDTVKVFTLFETTKADGTGLGLAIAKQIILAHKGNIDYAPAPPRGTVFHVDLPRLDPST